MSSLFQLLSSTDIQKQDAGTGWQGRHAGKDLAVHQLLLQGIEFSAVSQPQKSISPIYRPI